MSLFRTLGNISYINCSLTHKKLLITKLQFKVQPKDVTHNVTVCENNSLSRGDTGQKASSPTHTHTRAQAHTRTDTHIRTHTTHPFCASTTLRSNRCSSFILNHRRQGKPGELQAASAVRSQPGGSLRKTKPAWLWKPAVYCPRHFQQHGYWLFSLQRK